MPGLECRPVAGGPASHRAPSAVKRSPSYGGEDGSRSAARTTASLLVYFGAAGYPNEGATGEGDVLFVALQTKEGQMPAATAELQIVQVPIDELRPDPANQRKISDPQLDALTKSMRANGFVLPVIAKRDGTVIGGHQRLVAARRLGKKTVPVIFLDVSDEQAKLLNLALNKINGEWDQDLLAR